MSFRDWLHHVAIRGCIGAVFSAALCFTALAEPVGKDPGGQPGAQQAQEQPKPDNAPLILEAIQREIARVAGAIEAQKDEEEAKRNEAREIRDLEAQEGMALWARYLFYATCVTVALTLVGIFLIWRTLVHTRHAAESAHAMVVESEKATAAVVVGAQEAKRIGEAQARAYLAIELRGGILRDTIHNTQPHVVGNLENTGNTPASDVDFTIYVEFFRLPDEALLKVEGKQRIPHLTPKIKDHSFRVYMDPLIFSEDHLEMIVRQEVRMTVTVTVTFIDVFERLQSSGPVRFWGAPEMISDTRMNCSLGIRL